MCPKPFESVRMKWLIKHDALLPTEAELYQKLTKYLMTEEQLEENGYPRFSPDTPSKAVIKGTRYQETDALLKGLLFCLLLFDFDFEWWEVCMYICDWLFCLSVQRHMSFPLCVFMLHCLSGTLFLAKAVTSTVNSISQQMNLFKRQSSVCVCVCTCVCV